MFCFVTCSLLYSDATRDCKRARSKLSGWTNEEVGRNQNQNFHPSSLWRTCQWTPTQEWIPKLFHHYQDSHKKTTWILQSNQCRWWAWACNDTADTGLHSRPEASAKLQMHLTVHGIAVCVPWWRMDEVTRPQYSSHFRGNKSWPPAIIWLQWPREQPSPFTEHRESAVYKSPLSMRRSSIETPFGPANDCERFPWQGIIIKKLLLFLSKKKKMRWDPKNCRSAAW